MVLWYTLGLFGFVKDNLHLNRVVFFIKVSKSAERCHRSTPVISSFSKFRVHSCCMLLAHAVIVDLLGLNPCWLFGNRLFFPNSQTLAQRPLFQEVLRHQGDSWLVCNWPQHRHLHHLYSLIKCNACIF